MRTGKFFSSCLIVLVLLTAFSDIGQGGFENDKDHITVKHTIPGYFEFSSDVREDLQSRVAFAFETLQHNLAIVIDGNLADRQYDSYRRAHFIRKPAVKLFINFGALLI